MTARGPAHSCARSWQRLMCARRGTGAGPHPVPVRPAGSDGPRAAHRGEQAFVLVREWLGDPPRAADRESDLSGVARRFLAGHGPADGRDLAKWAGITLGDARSGLGAAGADLVERPGGL